MTSANQRSFSILAVCFLLTVLVFSPQAEPVAARGLAAGEQQGTGEDHLVYLPLISNIPPNTISGRVTRDGAGAAAKYVALDLYHNDSGWLRNIQLTNTDADGRYQFSDVPNLLADKYYVVRYENDPNAGNAFDPRCLSFWLSQSITSSTASDVNFDIADVLMDQVDGDHFPITFNWYARSTPFETYEFILYGPDFSPSHSFYDPGVFEYTLYDLPQGFQVDSQYYWGVYVIAETGGYGLSLVYPIVFIEAVKDTLPQVLPQQQLQFPKLPAALNRNVLSLP